jgi:hypothetical protein
MSTTTTSAAQTLRDKIATARASRASRSTQLGIASSAPAPRTSRSVPDWPSVRCHFIQNFIVSTCCVSFHCVSVGLSDRLSEMAVNAARGCTALFSPLDTAAQVKPIAPSHTSRVVRVSTIIPVVESTPNFFVSVTPCSSRCCLGA